MDTKWRSFSTGKAFKGFTLFLAIAAISAAALLFQLGFLQNRSYESILVKEYQDSTEYEKDIYYIINQVVNVTYSGLGINDADFLYALSNGSQVYSNTEYSEERDFANHCSRYLRLDNMKWTDVSTGKLIPYQRYIQRYYKGFIGLTEEYMSQKQTAWDQAREVLLPYFISFASLAFFGIILLLYQILITGKQPQDREIHLTWLDKLFPDVTLAMLVIFIYSYLFKMKDLLYDDGVIGFKTMRDYILICTDFAGQPVASAAFFVLIVAVFIGITSLLSLSLIRNLKAGRLIKDSALFKMISKLFLIMKDIFQYIFYADHFKNAALTKKLYCRQLITVIVLICMFVLAVFAALIESVLIIIPFALAILVIYWYIVGNAKIYQDIDQNLQVSLNEMMKSERMKIALITNVSHDLKTPLTSIISYVELLSKEEGMTEAASDYIKILQSKSERLKNIVTDLFELAKSTSGDVTLDYEAIDLKKLLEQTLVELEDRISASGLQIKLNLPDAPVTIQTDGKRLYRVFQNIIDNALKYSLKGTRVYIDLTTEHGKAFVTMKNIANYEMNFTSEEILQRFVRGDQARTEDGSGLGLSIAESFTRVCGGELRVEIDGDMFRVIISFPIIKN